MRAGKGIILPSGSLTSSDMPSSIGVSIMGVALLDLHFLGMSELRGCESPYDFSSFLTIFSLPRGLGRGEEATDGTISGTR